MERQKEFGRIYRIVCDKFKFECELQLKQEYESLCDKFEELFKGYENLSTPYEINRFVLVVTSCHRDQMRSFKERLDIKIWKFTI